MLVKYVVLGIVTFGWAIAALHPIAMIWGAVAANQSTNSTDQARLRIEAYTVRTFCAKGSHVDFVQLSRASALSKTLSRLAPFVNCGVANRCHVTKRTS
ncbi:hypothetical protein BH10ACI4_BH10ACI4_31100 [soil metagenome]